MFETLLTAEARRQAGRRRDVAAAALASALVALGAWGLAQSSGAEPPRVAVAAEQRAPAVPRGKRGEAAGAPRRDRAARRAGTRGASAEPRAPAPAPPEPGERGAPAAGAPRAASSGGSAPGRRTELALEPAGDTSVVAVERMPGDAPGDAPVMGAAESAAAGGGGAPGDAAAAWRITARGAGPHRLQLVATDVRDSAGRVDTLARRALGAVELFVAPDSAGAASAAPAAAWRRAAESPVVWLLACAASFALGSLHGRRRRGAGEDRGEHGDVGPDGRIPYGSG